MKLSECKHGVLVARSLLWWRSTDVFVGMVVGIGEVLTEEGNFPAPVVQWQDGSTSTINVDNLELYED